jgi:glyoxylase-like metal-dependent hydrolase (beta-lactamase superfamily II)
MMDLIRELKFEDLGDGIYRVETYYLNREGFTCCYLLEDNGEAAVIETNTNNAVPYILSALEHTGYNKSQVKYVILTHIHLDHAGGAGELMRLVPGAQLVLHPRGVRHMVNPEKLINSVKQVYGEEKYREYYGDILPVEEQRLKPVEDGEVIKVGNRELQLIETPGHAKHHIVVLDRQSGSLFSGDAFGIGYPRFSSPEYSLIFPSTSPTQFNPKKALKTYNKILDLDPSRMLLTHFGPFEDVHGAHTQLKNWIQFSEERAKKRYEEGYREDELSKILLHDIWEHFEEKVFELRGEKLSSEEKDFLVLDSELNAQGLAFYEKKINS